MRSWTCHRLTRGFWLQNRNWLRGWRRYWAPGLSSMRLQRRGPYECDGLTAYRCPPLAVVLPRTTEEVSAVLKICREMGVPVVPRGAGTSLAGGSLPTADSVILGVARMTEVLETSYVDRLIRVQTGRTNLSVNGRGGGGWIFLCAGPFLAACLCDCGQYRNEFPAGRIA